VQSQAAFDRIWLSLSLVVVQFEQLTALAASTSRLQQLLSTIDQRNQQHPSKSEIQIFDQPEIAVNHLTLQLPQASVEHPQALLTDLSFIVNESLLITGPSGVGKSSLAKAIAGLWESGEGTISYPKGNILFLPQQPYMTLGTLRQQLLYPDGEQATTTVSDRDLLMILKAVQLPDLDNLNQLTDWSGQLSTGEQQRLAFARLLIKKPTYALLDEATSALSIQQEKDLYQQLAKTNTTFISIGHRDSLLTYHPQVLTLLDSKTWTLKNSEA
ncbi:MAG: ATP-binding cassette domain-containing protein, partial [Cyanobacteria bacterium J06560_2]